jgi:hypothetical protein
LLPKKLHARKEEILGFLPWLNGFYAADGVLALVVHFMARKHLVPLYTGGDIKGKLHGEGFLSSHPDGSILLLFDYILHILVSARKKNQGPRMRLTTKITIFFINGVQFD